MSPEPQRLGQVLGAIATRLHPDILGTGDLAMLRRNPGTTHPALHRLLARHVPDARVDRDGIATWALLVHAMALAAPRGLAFGHGLGGPLFEADYKEGRLTRLLEARAEDLDVMVPRAVRFLIAHGKPLDPAALADFVFAVHAGGKRAEIQRTRIARDYYRAERQAGST